MQLRKKPDLPLDSTTNNSINSLPAAPGLGSPSEQNNVLSSHSEVESSISDKQSDTSRNKSQYGYLSWLLFFLVISILGAIALPNFTGGCVSKAKQAEAKQNISAMNRSQQAYFLDNKTFSNSLESLGVGIPTQTTNYNYLTRGTKTTAFSYGISRKGTKDIKSYVGGVFLVPATTVDPKADKQEITTVGIVCEAISPSMTQPTAPTLLKGIPSCGFGTKDLSRYNK